MTATEIKKIPIDQYNDIPSMQSELIKQMAQSKDQLCVDIIRQVLNREPVAEDFKRATFINHQSYPDSEFIAFDDKLLGRISWAWGKSLNGVTFTWTFEPGTTFK